MSDTPNNEAGELLAKAQAVVDGTAADVIAALPNVDPQLLVAALAAEQAGKNRVTVVAALNEVINPAPKEEPKPELVDMVLDEPQFEGGPVTAKVHPDEVDNYAVGGWKRA